MAKQDFIQNLHVARNLFFHRVANGLSHRTKRTETSHSNADLWLTPGATRGFNPEDFPELSEARRTELEQSVRKFGNLAARLPNVGPASTKVMAAARREFLRILTIMKAYLPTTDEVRRLREAIKQVPLPKEVLTWEFEFGQDSTDDPAVWIWFIVDDAAENDPDFAITTTRLAGLIHKGLQKAEFNRWPYVRFRTASEQRSLQAVHS